MKLLKKIWHAVVPEKVREFLWFLRCPDKKRFLEEKRNFKKVRNDFKNGNYNKENEKELLYMIEKKRLSVFPYSWTGDYSPDDVKVQFDEKKEMHYVNRGGGRCISRKTGRLKKSKATIRV
jgi:hypothetical protein